METLGRCSSLPSSAGVSPQNSSSAIQQSLLSKQSQQSGKAVWRARVLFIICLSFVAVTLGFLAHYFIKSSEDQLAVRMFESIADRALSQAVATSNQKRWSAITMSSVVSQILPNAGAYPFVTIIGFERMVNNLLNTSSNFNMGFAPLVEPSQLADWEDFMYEFYHVSRNPPFPNTTGVSDFGKGVWGRNPQLSNYTDKRYHDFGNIRMHGSPNKILAPVAHTNNNHQSILFFNLHSDATRSRAIDDMIDCSKERALNMREEDRSDRDCGVITEIVDFVKASNSGPSALIYTPIYPANDPTTMVGIISTPIFWDQLLSNAFADEVSGVYCVLETETTAFTYYVKDGIPVTLADEDLHQKQYNRFRRSAVVTADGFYTETSPTYRLSIYPSDELYAVYSTTNPATATIGTVCIIVFVSLLFFFYDFFVRRAFLEKKELLAAKRVFMRFISHEVRTPLNAVCMGLSIIQTEMAQALGFATVDELQAKAEDDESNPGANKENDTDSSITTVIQSSLPLASPPMSASNAFNILDWFRLSQDILRNTLCAVDVLNDVLNWDKIESGSMKLELARVSIWKAVEDVVNEFKLCSKTKNIDFRLKFATMYDEDKTSIDKSAHGEDADEQTPTIRFHQRSVSSVSSLSQDTLDRKVIADKTRIEQVIRNLLSNAFKFSPHEGSVCVRATWYQPKAGEEPLLSLRKIHLGGETISLLASGHVKVAVTDTGAGLTQSQLQCLFREGIQFNVDELQQGKGSGFGLFIAKGIVELHEGTLVAFSPGLGKGTTFELTLPLYYAPDVAEDRAQSSRILCLPTTTGAVSTSKRNLLVVDDVASNRKLLGRLLSKSGHSCDLADDGDVAVAMMDKKAAEGRQYDTVLLDYEMPRMNGPMAAKEMRRRGYSNAFIIGVTGNMLPEDVSYFLSCGANAVLPKPVNIKDLEDLWTNHGLVSRTDDFAGKSDSNAYQAS